MDVEQEDFLEILMPLSRRDLLRASPLGLGAFLAPRTVAQPPTKTDPRFPGMIVRMEQPRNLETPLTALQTDLPTEHFYVRSHFAVPEVDPKTFQLTVEGHVEKKLELTLEDVKKMGTASKSITLECAGNGRVHLIPQARGLQWGNGAVGTAKWGGVPLSAILNRAMVKPWAIDVVLIGADRGAINSDPPSPGAIHYDRGIPLAKAIKDETLLAWEMNGDPLPVSHGAPLRAIVGGWYGMASVKWLTRIIVMHRPHQGFWQTMDYSVWERKNGGLAELTPVAAMLPKAVVTRPTPLEIVKAGEKLTVTGLAWAGENAPNKVEVSADGGKTWQPATIAEKGNLVWSSWHYEWTVPKERGPAKLIARCTDDRGNTQPPMRDPDRRTYAINHLVPVEVLVK